MTDWLNQAIECDRGGRIDAAIDVLFDNFDNLLSAGDFATTDAVIAQVAIANVSLTFLMGVLSITLPASDKLANRKPLFNAAWEMAIETERPAEALLGGLRSWEPLSFEAAEAT